MFGYPLYLEHDRYCVAIRCVREWNGVLVFAHTSNAPNSSESTSKWLFTFMVLSSEALTMRLESAARHLITPKGNERFH